MNLEEESMTTEEEDLCYGCKHYNAEKRSCKMSVHTTCRGKDYRYREDKTPVFMKDTAEELARCIASRILAMPEDKAIELFKKWGFID